jgi:ABC-2 type transport system permease protein
MSAVATAPRPQSIPADAHVSFPRLVRAEWIKFWSVRSTVWTLSIMALAMIALVTLISLAVTASIGEMSAEDGPIGLVPFTFAVQMASIAVVVLGVLTISGEYTTGMIRASLAAAPRRTPVLWSKVVVLASTIFIISLVVVAISVAVQMPILNGKNVGLDLGDGDTQRVLVGNALYLTMISLFAFAFGALLRHSAAALATVLGLVLVVETVVNAVPWEPLEYVRPFLPSSAGSKITQPQLMVELMNEVGGKGFDFGPWGGFAVLVVWVLVILGIAAVLLKKRDA